MQNVNPQIADDEISVRDIICFLRANQKLIALFGITGVLIASAYVILIPKKYEASWQLQMAQYSSHSNSNSNIINIEEPAALVERLRTPATFSLETRQHCGLPVDGEFGEYLDKKLDALTLKNVPTAVGMKYRAASAAQAKQCAEAIVAMVIAQQHSLIEERIAGRRVQLEKYQQTMTEEQRLLDKSNNSRLGSLDILVKLDKIRWLRSRVDELQEELLLSQLHPAKLIASIYVPGKPVSAKAGLMLLLGMSLGLLLGVLYATGREGWRRVR